jgi:natural product precursor
MGAIQIALYLMKLKKVYALISTFLLKVISLFEKCKAKAEKPENRVSKTVKFFVKMKKLQKLNLNVFEKFKKDEISELNQIRGGYEDGVSMGIWDGTTWCGHDEVLDGEMHFWDCEAT